MVDIKRIREEDKRMIVQKIFFIQVANETRLKMTLHIITCLITTTVDAQLTIIELYFAIQPFAKFFRVHVIIGLFFIINML